ncbi:ASCH domain-containing protein [Methylomonas sp. MO1]|uniref:ASCH domain-containing protein n=1 Tax=Methylomonas sp. MO1 TaxID=3073619 RepID=UPI0028A4F0A7|nr:ASCH domain-containing protein [Methylomonas sp. MO1]MDT4288837.1 ASCH domain-containing protein [Methylomonas sp. MO1]
MKPTLAIAFYPIKPIYSSRILSGEKKYELRKRLPKNPFDYILIYATSPIGKVVGYAKVKMIHKNTVSDLWEMVSLHAGITKDDYINYFNNSEYAYAIELETVKRFTRPFDPKEINSFFSIPQSFCYISRNDFNRLKRRKGEHVQI